MKILHILNDGPSALADAVIREQLQAHEVTVIDLSGKEVSYEDLVSLIFLSDRVISW